MKLLIHGVPAVEGMEVITGNGEKGILTSWSEPHKAGSTGRVYVKIEGKSRSSEYFPSVVGGKWENELDELYNKIGKEFEDYDFSAKPFGKPPLGWDVEVEEKTNIEYLEIVLHNDDDDDDEENVVPKLEEIKTFTYIKNSQVLTTYTFTRKE